MTTNRPRVIASDQARAGQWVPALAIAALLTIVIARSWLCDDAYITLRTVDNLVNGFGPRWNTVDRVQTYTHPLWMLLLTIPYALTREPYFTTLAMSWLLTTVAAIVLVLRLAATPLSAAWAVLALALSAAFADYSTSGLENPLSHALLAWFLVSALASPRRILAALLAASAICLTRPDAILLLAPALGAMLWSTRRALPWAQLTLGLLPLLLWAAFSLTYYGFALPNTAYAKLGSGIPRADLAWQGLRYLAESLRHDPLTLCLVVSACALTLMRGVSVIERALAFGIALHLVWIVQLGGDFMSGRFLTAPLFVAVATIARRDLGPRHIHRALVLGTLLLGVLSPRASWRVAAANGGGIPIDAHGIADERSFYLDTTGLAARLRSGPDIALDVRTDALALRRRPHALIQLNTIGCGIFGYYAGPHVHIIDGWALADPLLARLPALRRLHFRIGHFARGIPPGYLKTLASGRNQLQDPALARYWDQLALAVRAPLFSWPRWRAIALFNLGRTDRLLDRERYRLAELVVTDAIRANAGVSFGDGGLDVRFDKPVRAAHVALMLQGGARFSLSWYRGAQLMAAVEHEASTSLTALPQAEVDRLRVLPLQGDGSYRITRCAPVD